MNWLDAEGGEDATVNSEREILANLQRQADYRAANNGYTRQPIEQAPPSVYFPPLPAFPKDMPQRLVVQIQQLVADRNTAALRTQQALEVERKATGEAMKAQGVLREMERRYKQADISRHAAVEEEKKARQTLANLQQESQLLERDTLARRRILEAEIASLEARKEQVVESLKPQIKPVEGGKRKVKLEN